MKDDFDNSALWEIFGTGDEWFKLRNDLFLLDSSLYINDKCHKVVVPKRLVSMILKLHHDIPLAGHRDFEKTYKSISDKYFWLEMHKEIKKYCASCYLCQTKKHLGKSSRAPLKTIIVRTPWGLIGLDFAGPLKKTINGMLYIILAICYFTKFCVAKAVKDCTALTAAKFVYEEVI